MHPLFYMAFIEALLIWLFIRDCQLDRKRALENQRKGNLHALKEFRSFFEKNEIETEQDFKKEIEKLENQSYEIKIRDYFSLIQY